MLKKIKDKCIYWFLVGIMKIYGTKDPKNLNVKTLKALKNIYEVIERLLIFFMGVLFGTQDPKLFIIIGFLLILAIVAFLCIKIREKVSK